MRLHRLIYLTLPALATLLPLPTAPAFGQANVQIVAVDVRAVGEGYRTSKLRGATVHNDQNERIGTIDDIIVDKERVLFAIIQVGGFLGIGGHLVAVPYSSLEMQDPAKIVLPGATKDALKNLPEFKYV